ERFLIHGIIEQIIDFHLPEIAPHGRAEIKPAFIRRDLDIICVDYRRVSIRTEQLSPLYDSTTARDSLGLATRCEKSPYSTCLQIHRQYRSQARFGEECMVPGDSNIVQASCQ